MVICFTVWNPIFDFLTRPLCDALARRGARGCGLILIALQEGFFVAINISLLGGLVLGFPIISYQMWRFVAPGLYRSEKGAFLPFLIASPFMFFLGAAFAYYVITPLAFDFFLGFQQPGSLLTRARERDRGRGHRLPGLGAGLSGPDDQVHRGLRPVLPAAGAADADGQGRAGQRRGPRRDTRKYAVVGILVLAAVATPPDVVSQVILFTVVYGLYEISIFLVARIERKREARTARRGPRGSTTRPDGSGPGGRGSESDRRRWTGSPRRSSG